MLPYYPMFWYILPDYMSDMLPVFPCLMLTNSLPDVACIPCLMLTDFPIWGWLISLPDVVACLTLPEVACIPCLMLPVFPAWFCLYSLPDVDLFSCPMLTYFPAWSCLCCLISLPDVDLFLPDVDYVAVEWQNYIFRGQLLVGGYLLHYLPYMSADRTLFLHHYLPAVIFKILVLAALLDHLVARHWR